MSTVTVTNSGTAGIGGLTSGARYVARVRRVNSGGGEASVWSRISSPQTVGSSGITANEDLDIGSGKILYSNVYQTVADLPPAANYHGMFAHVHDYDGLGNGAAVYAHAGNWVRLADNDNLESTAVTALNGLKGSVTLAAGTGTLVSQLGNVLTISSTQTFTSLNGEAGDVTLAGGDNVQVSTQDGIIIVSASDSSTVNGLTGNVSIVAGANINVATTGQNVVISGEQGGIQWSTPPQNSSAPGDPGDVAYDDNYLYLRTSQAWRQIALQPVSSNITITQQPQSASVEDGQQATFTVLANAPEAISYQWSSSTDGTSFAAINGATSNTLTINVTLADNGSQYRALLSAAGAADVTTNVATLTVNETFRLLTANNDTLMTENGEVLNHDGVGGGGGGGNQPSDDWEQDGTAFSSGGRVYGYSPDADILYWPTDTTSSGFGVQGLQRYERDANGTFSAVGNAVNTGWNTPETVPGISSSADGSKAIVVNDQWDGSDSVTYSFAGYTVYEYANGTLSSVYSGSQDSYTLVAISGDGSVWAAYRDDGTVRVESGSGLIGTAFSTGGDVYHIALNNDGSKFAMSRYGDVTSDGNADSYTRAYQWTGSAWTQMGGDFLSTANVSAGMPSQPIAFSSAGSRIAIGFSTESGDHTESGVVRVYDWSGSAWSQAGSDISGGAAYDLFGSSVSLSSDGTRLAVGARGNDSAASNAGRTSVYQYSAGSWFKIGTDIDGPASTNAYAGSEVFLSGDGNYLGVGASGAETLTRYGLQTNQITITQQPQDATYSGSPVTFSTLATVSDNSTPSYQWQSSTDNGSTWATVANATASNLTINSAVAGDDGNQYRAVVSAGRAPDVTTSAATLTVT